MPTLEMEIWQIGCNECECTAIVHKTERKIPQRLVGCFQRVLHFYRCDKRGFGERVRARRSPIFGPILFGTSNRLQFSNQKSVMSAALAYTTNPSAGTHTVCVCRQSHTHNNLYFVGHEDRRGAHTHPPTPSHTRTHPNPPHSETEFNPLRQFRFAVEFGANVRPPALATALTHTHTQAHTWRKTNWSTRSRIIDVWRCERGPRTRARPANCVRDCTNTNTNTRPHNMVIMK